MRFERKFQPLASRWIFFQRMAVSLFLCLLVIGASLALGTFGYHYWGGAEWLDAAHNAAMILTGMGPVTPITSTAGKLFSIFYALFSGIAFLYVDGHVVTVPWEVALPDMYRDQLVLLADGSFP